MRNISLILFLIAAGFFSSKTSAQSVILKADTVEVPCISTDTFLVPVRLDNFTNVSGLQFTLQWDTLRLDYAYVTMLDPQFVGVGFDTSAATLALGKLTFAWTDLAGLSLPPNTVLFKVAYRRIGGPPAPISFVNDPTSIAVFDNQFNELPSETHNGLVKALDSVGPTLTCPASVITGFSGPVPILNIASVFSDNCGTPIVGWSSAGATVANFPTDPDASGALFNLGLSTVTYKATDAGGNTATCSFDILVEFNISTNDFTLIANPNNLASCGGTVSIDVLAFNFDSIGGLQFSMEWLPAVLEFVSITNPNPMLNIGLGNFNTDSSNVGLLTFAWTTANIPAGSTIAPGDVLFTLTYNVQGAGTVTFGTNPTAPFAFTGAGDEILLVTLDAIIVVTDTIPPSIACPADILVQAPGATAVQAIAPLSVDDNCAAPSVGWTVSGATNGSYPNDPDASGSLFNLGVSNVTYTATDASGSSATCSFNVTVEFANNTTDLTIIANSANASCNGGFSMDITALNFETVAGLQFTVNWDATLYQYTSVSNFNLPIGIGISNFGIDSVGVGAITFAWTSADLNGASVNNGDILFSLNFDMLVTTPSGITFGDSPTSRVAFDGGSFDEITVMTVDGQVSVVDNVPPIIVCPSPAPVDAPTGQVFATVNGLEPSTLSDNCAGIPGLTYTQSGAGSNAGTGNANGDYNAGTTTVIYTATDGNGNTATCSFQVVVDAGTPLVLQLDTADLGCQGTPSTITVNLTVENFNDIIGLQFGLDWDHLVLQLVTPVPIQYVNSGPPPIFVNQANGSLVFFGGHPGWPDVPNDSTILALTFNVLDVNALASTFLSFVGPYDALNSSFDAVPVQTINGAFIFTLDNTPPVVTCPTDTVLTAPTMTCTASYNPIAPAAIDDCGAIASVSISPDTTIFATGLPTVLTYTVTDEAGNVATCLFMVTVLDIDPPQVSGCPQLPIIVGANSNCQANAFWVEPTFLDACDQTNLTVIHDYDPGGLFSLDTTLVNYEATDQSGNTITCTFEVIVRDTTPPALTCPADMVITPLNGCTSVVNFAMPTATDNCDMGLNVICSDTSGSVFSGVTTVTCAVLDNDGNVGQCSFTITVLDTMPPLFPNGCPMDTIIASASGNCGANPSWQAPTATDNCDSNLIPMPSQAPGTFFDVQNSPHTVTYTATDNFGNTATCSFTVTVTDNTAPLLTNCPLPILKFLPVDSCFVTLGWTPPMAADNCGAGGITLTSNLVPGVFPTGDTIVVYTATDASGNTSSCSFSISVKDVIPPVIDCPTVPIPVPVPNPCGVIPIWSMPSATDNCTPVADLVYSSAFWPDSVFQPGTTMFVVRVTDASGNFDECELTVNNNVLPRFTNVPGLITIDTCPAVATWIDPIPVDFCPPIQIVVTPLQSGDIFPFGTTTVTYTATDSFGNTATATFNVVVSETVPPVFDCPVSPIVVDVVGNILSDPSQFLTSADTTGCDGAYLTFNFPNASDNCVTPAVTLLQGLPSGSEFPIGFNELVFRAVDSSGNLSQCAVFIEVTALPALDPVVDPRPGCEGDPVSITASNIPGATYTWIGPLSSSTNVLVIPNLSAQNDGQYIVSASIKGCNAGPDTAIVYMTLMPTAVNDLNYEINPGETITFPSVLANDLLSPAFDFSICDDSIDLEGLVMNYTDGTFTYTAGESPGMVSFLYGVCSRTCDLESYAAVTITINDTKCEFVPNIFTPNGDGTNDFFEIPCIDTGLFRENTLVVYSQWGDKVFEASPYSNDPTEAWDGTLDGEDGKDLPDGVYFYIFKAGANLAPKKGFVELFR